MPTKYLLVFLFLCCGHMVFSQTEEIEQQLQRLKAHPQHDSLRSEILLDVAYAYETVNRFLALKFYNESKLIAEKNNPDLLGGLHLNMGFIYESFSNYGAALKNYLEAEKIYKELDNPFYQAKTYLYMAGMYDRQGLKQKVFDHLNRSEQLVNTVSDTKFKGNKLFILGSVYDIRATVFTKRKQYDSAFIYSLKSIDVAKQNEDTQMLNNVLVNHGVLLKNMGKFEEANQTFQDLYNRWKNTNDYYFQAVLYHNMGANFAAQKKFSEAEHFFNLSMEKGANIDLGDLHIQNLDEMAKMYESMGDYKAQATCLKEKESLKDSTFNKDKLVELNQLEKNYTDEQNQLALQAQQNQKRNILQVLIILAVVSTGLGYFFYQSRKRNKILRQQKMKIETQNVELNALNRTKDKLFGIISHDLRNPLLVLNSYVKANAQTDLTPEKKMELQKNGETSLQLTLSLMDNLMTWAKTQLQTNAVSMNRVELDELLDSVLVVVQPQAVLKNISLQVNLATDTTLVVSNFQLLEIILRNLISNAIKFTNTYGVIEISAVRDKEFVQLSVIDNGVGMTPEQLENIAQHKVETTEGTSNEKGSGLGWSIISDLLKKMNTAWKIQSQPNEGTTVSIWLDRF